MPRQPALRALICSALFGAFLSSAVDAQAPDGPGGVVRGTVFDSIAGAPLEDAAVFLWNTSYRTTTDASGEFTIPDVPPGDYTLLFFHTRLGELGISPGPRPIHVGARDTVDVALATPSDFTVRVSRCLLEDTPPGTGAVAGRVGDGKSGMGLPNAHVTLSWPEEGSARPTRLRLDTDADGWYSTCVAPTGTPISTSATFLDRQGLRREVTVPEHGSAHLDFLVWRVDPAQIAGRVRDASSGEGVGDAEVWLRGTSFHSLTDSHGSFRLGEVPPGTYMMFVRHLAYGTQSDTLVVASGKDLSVDMRVDTRAIEIDPITVTTDAVPITRRAMGGTTITRSQLDKVRGRVRDVADIMQTLQVPGVIVRRRSDGTLCVGYTSGQVRMLNNVSGRCIPMRIYINDVRATNSNLALQMPPESIDRIVVFRPLEAGNLFGAGSGDGVIVIYTHNR